MSACFVFFLALFFSFPEIDTGWLGRGAMLGGSMCLLWSLCFALSVEESTAALSYCWSNSAVCDIPGSSIERDETQAVCHASECPNGRYTVIVRLGDSKFLKLL